MNKNEEKRDRLIRETFDQCLSGIDGLPSLRPNILAKAKDRSLKWEPVRFRIPAIAMCLVLVLAFGFLAGTGRLSLSASPDEIKAGSQYTVQPIDVSLTEGGQNATTDETDPSVIDQLAAAFPDLRDGLKPLSLSAENEDIRLNVISGRDRKGHITLLYTLEDLKARWFRDGDSIDVAPAFVQTEPFAGISGQVRQETLSGTHTKAGVANMMVHDQFQPDDTFTFTIDNLSVWENAIVDLLPVLEEHGTATEGTALPDGALPRKHFDDAGTPSIAHDLNDLKVLDYNNPLDIALGDYAVLTGIGWIDNQLHVQVHRTRPVSLPVSQIGLADDMAMGIRNTVSGRQLPCQLVEWRAKNSYDYTWMEFIWDSTPEDISEELEADITFLVDYVAGPWSVEIPAGAIQPDESAAEQAAADEESGERPVKVSMELSKVHVSPGDEINVLISVTNTTDEDLPGIVELYDADGDKVPVETEYTLAAGETKSWYEPWQINEDELETEKITYSIKYSAYDGPANEDGKPSLKEHKISFSRRIYPVSGSVTEEQFSFTDPGVENELKPLNLSTEQQGLRVDLVSGLVQKNNAWFVYKLYDPDISEETALRYDYFMKNSQVGQFRFYHPYESASAHTYIDTFDTDNYGEPIASIAENGIITVGIENPVFYQNVNWDLTSLLKEYGTVSDGVLAPSQAEEGPQVYGGPNLPEVSLGAVVLDYTRPLNISLCPDADLTGIGWIGNRFHVQFHYTGNQPFLRAGDNMFSWEADCTCKAPDNKDLPWTTIVWDDNSDGCYDWMEFVWDCTPETGISYLSANLIFPTKVKSGSWTFDVPLSSVTTDELVMTEEQDASLQAEMDSESPISVIMMLEKNLILPGETIDVGLTLFNRSEDGLLAGPVKLYDPSGKKIIDYQIDEGEEIYWNGACTVTREMLLDGRLTFTMEYSAFDGLVGEDGKPTLKEHTIRFSREICWPCIDDETAAELEKLPTNERAKAILERSYPDLAADLKPFSVSCEDQGLRINLDYGVIKGDQACFIWTLEDPEGKIIREGLNPVSQCALFDNDHYSIGSFPSPSSYVDYEKHVVSFTEIYKFDQPYQPVDGDIGIRFSSPYNELAENVDLAAALREYGKVTEGVEMPSTETAGPIEFYAAGENAPEPPKITKDTKILDYTHPIDIPLIRDISLTGIGWIDNQLHIQIHYTGDDTYHPDVPDSWEVFPVSFLSGNPLPYSWIEWNENYNGMFSWKEFVLDCSPDDINRLTLRALCNLVVDTTSGHWSVSIPVSDILADEAGRDEPLTVTDEETAVLPTDAPAIPTETILPDESAAEPDVFPTYENEKAHLEKFYPDLAADLKPLSVSCEDQGLRINLDYGVVKGDMSCFFWTLEDPEGKIIKEGLDPVSRFDLLNGDQFISGTDAGASFDVDYEKRVASFSGIFRSDIPYQSGNSYIGIRFPAPYNELFEKVDLTAALREYGKVTEGVEMPSTAAVEPYQRIISIGDNVPQAPELTKDTKILDYNHPIDIPLIRDISLTGIGWIDNQLHIQVHYTGKDSGNSDTWNVFPQPLLSGNVLPFSWIEWCENNNGTNDWREFVLDCSPDAINQLRLEAKCSLIVDTIRGNWSFRIPVSDILAEEADRDESLTVTDEETAVLPTDVPAIPTETILSDESAAVLPADIPEIPAGMKPLNFSSDLGDIRFNLTSGLMKGNEFWFTLTLADQDGRQYTDCSDMLSLSLVVIGNQTGGWWSTVPSLVDTDRDGYGETFLVHWNGEFIQFENGSICLMIQYVSSPDALAETSPVIFTIPVDAILSDKPTAEEPFSGKPIKVAMELSKSSVSEGDTVDVEITLTNQWDTELPDVVQLYAPDGELLSQWKFKGKREFIVTDSLTITAEQLKQGKITYAVKYKAYDGQADEYGAPTLQTHKINFSKKITPAE